MTMNINYTSELYVSVRINSILNNMPSIYSGTIYDKIGKPKDLLTLFKDNIKLSYLDECCKGYIVLKTDTLIYYSYSGMGENFGRLDISAIDYENYNEVKTLLENTFVNIPPFISWHYLSEKGDLEFSNSRIIQEVIPFKEIYPNVNTPSLQEYYNKFLESRSNVLILLGCPGTGKTSFIKDLLVKTENSAMVTYDDSVIYSDKLFIKFIKNTSPDILVLEDCDTLISSRDSGNKLMQKFLNLSDGLVSTKHKKLIFSTNLTSISKIDPALLRKGRCFDVLEFRPLNLEEANKVCKISNIPEFTKDGNYTIAEIFNRDEQQEIKKQVKMGFN
jgi:hypothetical protein